MHSILDRVNPFSAHARGSAASKRRGRRAAKLSLEALEGRALMAGR